MPDTKFIMIQTTIICWTIFEWKSSVYLDLDKNVPIKNKETFI